MTTQETSQLVRRFIEEVWNQGKVELIGQLVAPSYIDHSMSLLGLDGLKQWIQATSAAFEHTSVIESQITQDDNSALRIKFQAKHIGEWRGIAPTYRQVETTAYRFYRVADGRIIEHWGYVDGTKLESALRAEASPV